VGGYAMLLAWSCLSDLPSEHKESAEVSAEKIYTIAECKKLSIDEFDKYVEELGHRRNYAALKALCKAKFGYAITVYSQFLSDEEALRFCKSFAVGSYEWENAFWGLSFHRKEAVIGYVKDTCNTKNPWVRGSCYSLCLKAGWDDLVENAKRDFDDEAPMMAIGVTLGTRARNYVKMLPEVQKQLNKMGEK
jgi:hypothetical protein